MSNEFATELKSIWGNSGIQWWNTSCQSSILLALVTSGKVRKVYLRWRAVCFAIDTKFVGFLRQQTLGWLSIEGRQLSKSNILIIILLCHETSDPFCFAMLEIVREKYKITREDLERYTTGVVRMVHKIQDNAMSCAQYGPIKVYNRDISSSVWLILLRHKFTCGAPSSNFCHNIFQCKQRHNEARSLSYYRNSQ